ETAPPPFGFGLRPGRTGFETGPQSRPRPLVIRGTTLSHLSRTIEAEIIPRLVMAHGDAAQPHALPIASTDQIDAIGFADLILGAESNRAAEFVQAYRDRGVALETIYLTLLVPTARHLRSLWMNDERDFAAVTLAL